MSYNKLYQMIDACWYKPNLVTKYFLFMLQPLSWLFICATLFRKYFYLLFYSKQSKTPIIIIGGINVGGSGKTSLVIYVANTMLNAGLRVGIIMRGYTGTNNAPMLVTPSTAVKLVGDEALVLAKNCACPIVTSSNRTLARDYLLKHYPIDVIISDDGLQHYALPRNIAIIVLDGIRKFGNGYCLPLGPLREPRTRLNTVDLIVSKHKLIGLPMPEYLMEYNLIECININTNTIIPLTAFRKQKVHAIAAIADPESFFSKLKHADLQVIPHIYPDHYTYQTTDLIFNDDLPILVTEKDAVKCQSFANQNLWCVKLSISLDVKFMPKLMELLNTYNKLEG